MSGGDHFGGNLLHQEKFTIRRSDVLCQQAGWNILRTTKLQIADIQHYLAALSFMAKMEEGPKLYEHLYEHVYRHLTSVLPREEQPTSAPSGEEESENPNWNDGGTSQSQGKPGKFQILPGDQKPLMVLGRCLFLLSVAIDELVEPTSDAVSIGTGSEASIFEDGVWTRQMDILVLSISTYLRILNSVEVEETRLIMDMTYFMCAEGLLHMGKSVLTFEEEGGLLEEDLIPILKECARDGEARKQIMSREKLVKCFETALHLVQHRRRQQPIESPIIGVRLYQEKLMALIRDCLGKFYHQKGNYLQSMKDFEHAAQGFRNIVAILKEDDAEDETRQSPSVLSMFTLGKGASPDLLDVATTRDLFLDNPNTDRDLDGIHLALSQTLEYYGMALHSSGLCLEALDAIQEAVVTRTMFHGKLSLRVADLHAAIGTINDDLGMWEESLPRYMECLRIRIHFLEIAERDGATFEAYQMKRSIVHLLRCMASAHRMINDYDKALECHWKIAKVTSVEFRKLATGRKNGDDRNILCAGIRKLQLPTLVLDEHRAIKKKARGNEQEGKTTKVYHHHEVTINPEKEARSGTDNRNDFSHEEDIILRETAQAYLAILSLLREKALVGTKGKSTAASLRNGTVNLATALPEDNVPLLLSTSYKLGLINMHFGEYTSAISVLEHSLRSIWIVESSSSESSSGSDEDDQQSKKRVPKKFRKARMAFTIEADFVAEDEVYHALGLSHSALHQHEKAVRFHLTALRYARKAYGMESLRAAELLYDTGTSYWYLDEWGRAAAFWSDCLRIRQRYDNNDNVPKPIQDAEKMEETVQLDELADTFYSMGASFCARGKYGDPRVIDSFDAAKVIYESIGGKENRLKFAHCLYYLGFAYYGCARVSIAMKEEDDQDSVSVSLGPKGAPSPSPMEESLDKAMDYLKQASGIYRVNDIISVGENGRLTGNPTMKKDGSHPIQAHICFLQGNIFFELRDYRNTMRSFSNALQIYKVHGSGNNTHRAAVLHSMGTIYNSANAGDQALRCLNESARLRQQYLGDEHEALAATLFDLAHVHIKRQEYSISMNMLGAVLRIRTSNEGENSANVARTLMAIGILLAQQAKFGQAEDRMSGAVRIWRDRLTASEITRRGKMAERKLKYGDDSSFKDMDLSEEENELSSGLHFQGCVLLKMNEIQRAFTCFEQSLALRRKQLQKETEPSDDDLLAVADSLHCIGFVRELRNEFHESLLCYKEALVLKCGRVVDPSKIEETNILVYTDDEYEKNSLNPSEGMSYAATLYRVGMVHSRMGKIEIAIDCIKAAFTIQSRHLGPDHIIVATTLTQLGNVMQNTCIDDNKALACYKGALNVKKKQLGIHHTDVGVILYKMGNLYDSHNDFLRASGCYKYALRVYGRQYLGSMNRAICLPISTKRQVAPNSLPVSLDELSTPMSIAEVDQLNREFYKKVASAFRASSKNMPIHPGGMLIGVEELDNPGCVMQLELLLLEFIHHLNHSLMDPLSQAAREAALRLILLLEHMGSQAIVSAKDTMAYNINIMIQE
eukprot:CAMPEP_0118677296 /NCGR_PEP_ID=MMETSP0800-20121206/2549_1 /TAXON_ID=210618 ORGANISM="Striatella unipunctata, Strain CCMP2910" /NCGR_SAMPLE_ID=MMETSP0800 /ASSEMBLY_ACC=CAM_ASM_000638 /LENGTH=1535 /DNA_ID=CAMNT_0006572955 /DNA_START=207 /DNA_END=4814 /DNA_ORIENTATION=-